MKQKEYPMDEDYNRALKFLTDQIAERDEMREQLKFLPPEARPEALRLLAELDKAIERTEQALANDYEAYQAQRRAEDERDKIFDELTEGLAGSYVHVKYRNPEMLPKLDEVIAAMPPEDAKAFHEAVARHEAGDLVRIIRREGETREEAEEFLKNYRAEHGYEMSDDYKQAQEDLLDFIKVRDILAEAIKTMPPDKERENQELLAEMNETIENCEAKLAKEYESYQVYMRAQEKQDEIMSDVLERMQMVYILTKHRLPDNLPELEAAIFDGWAEEEIQKFLEGVAVLEATRLEEIIAEAKEDEKV
jgi:hypothetical protein